MGYWRLRDNGQGALCSSMAPKQAGADGDGKKSKKKKSKKEKEEEERKRKELEEQRAEEGALFDHLFSF